MAPFLLYQSEWFRNEPFLESVMANQQSRSMAGVELRPFADRAARISREQLIELLNDDLAREYQAIIAYVVYSQTLKGAAYMTIAADLEQHARQELDHALIIAKHIDYLGGTPTVRPKTARQADDPLEMLRFDLENEIETVINYRERIGQCEALGEFAIAEQIRQILVQEQQHQIDLAAALGQDVAQATASVQPA
jgi:bacterioferritin